MIIVRIFGGLGNQLFQYAAARALAEHYKTDVKLDLSQFANYTLRNFDLSKLSVPFSVATEKEVSGLKANNSVQRIKERLLPYKSKQFYKEPFFHYDSSFFRLSKNVYLQGYFQSVKYFSPIERIIRKEYDFLPLVSNQIKNEGERLRHEVSVSLHIRRGDYTKPEMLNIHGALSVEHYQNAVGLIKEKYPDARFYIFSDEPAAAAKELKLSEAIVVSGERTKTHFEDFYLMSQCRHNIIANSSFSWWSAWLNTTPEKTVIAPKSWFRKGPKDMQDLLPENWIKL